MRRSVITNHRWKNALSHRFSFLLFLTVSMIGLSPATHAEDLDLSLHQNFDQGYTVSIIENDLDHVIEAEITLTNMEILDHRVELMDYTVISIPEAGVLRVPGKPMIPVISTVFHISDTLAPYVTVEPLSVREVPIDNPVIPVQDDHDLIDIRSIEMQDRDAYISEELYPAKLFRTSEPMIFRDVRLLNLKFYPVRYSAGSETLEITDRVRIRIEMLDRASENQLLNHGPVSPSFEPIYRAIAVNYSDAWHETINHRDRGAAEHYLLIMPDEFESRCQGFIAWKEEQGFDVDIIRFSDLGSNPTAATVKSAVQTLYDSSARPVYVSILGNTNNFPTYTSYDDYMGGNYNDDLYYSLLDGTDLLPDTLQSRYPACTPDELSTMMAKVLYYEQTPNLQNHSYYKTAFFASAYRSSQQLVKEQNASRLELVLDYSTIHTMYGDAWNQSGSVTTAQNWINQGVSIINYRGEGWQSGWNPVGGYVFNYSRVAELSNRNLLPVITSVGCGVSMFSGYNDSFGHMWMKLGSPGNLKGAVAFYGPTYNTRTTINNWMDRGIYRGFCYHDLHRSMQAINYGKLYAFLKDDYPPSENVQPSHLETHQREYVLFGAPDMWWRTAFPRSAEIFNAWCPSSSGHGVVVIDEQGNKVVNTQISFLKDGEQRVYTTDGGGGCRVYMSDVTDPVPAVVTGYNLLPVFTSFDLPETGDDGDIIITEVKPDIQTTGTAGDLVELANLETLQTVNLKGWTLGDLDGYDIPFVSQDAVLGPQQIAVIELVGYHGVESVTATAYGLYITSRSQVGLSSLEDSLVVRNTEGRVRDAIFWHNGTGIGSTNESGDLSKMTQPTTPLSIGVRGWWTGPDEVTQAQYESLTIDWSEYSGNGGPGSIKRTGIPGAGVWDSPDYFEVSSEEEFGQWVFPTHKQLLSF